MKVDGGRLAAMVLKSEGINCVFTVQSAGMASYYEGCVAEDIRIVDMRHEQAAVMAADAWARISRMPGVAMIDAGPGFGNGYTGLSNAYMAGSAVLCIGRGFWLSDYDRGQLMELPVEHPDLARPVTKWSKTCFETERIPEYLRAGLRHAVSGRPGPVYFECPREVQTRQVVQVPEVASSRNHRSTGVAAGEQDCIDRAADLLIKSQRPVVLGGSGLHWSRRPDGLEAFVSRTSVPTFLNGSGRGALHRDHPCRFSMSRRDTLRDADLAIIVGAALDFRMSFGQPPYWPHDLPVIQIDIDPTEIGRNRPIDLGIVGDPGVVLWQVTEKIGSGPGVEADPTWLASVRDYESKYTDELEALATSSVVPIHPLRLVKEIRDAIQDRDPVVIVDGGFIANFSSQFITPNALGDWLDPGPMGCLGIGQPFAIGAKYAAPEREILLISGDGAFGFNCMEFDTMVRHGLAVTCVVANNGCWEQDALRENPIACELNQNVRHDELVEALGGAGERVTTPDEIGGALRRAFSSGKPYCIDVVLSNDVHHYSEVGRGRRFGYRGGAKPAPAKG